MDDRKDVEMKFVCPHSWETLEPTSSDDNEKEVRFCNDCSKEVYWCSSEAEIVSHGTQGHCVAFNFARGVAPSCSLVDDFGVMPSSEGLTSSDQGISSEEVLEPLVESPRDADERRWLYYTDGEHIKGPVSRSELEFLPYSNLRESFQTSEGSGRWQLIYRISLLLKCGVLWVAKMKGKVVGPKKNIDHDHARWTRMWDGPTAWVWVWRVGYHDWVDLFAFLSRAKRPPGGWTTAGVPAPPLGPDYFRRKELAALRVVYVNSLRMIGSGVIGFAFGSIALPFLPTIFVIYTAIMSSFVGSAWIVQRYRLTQVLNKIEQEKKRREKIHAQMPPLPGSISSSTNSSEIKERVDAINHTRGNQMLIILNGAFGIGCAFMAGGFILMFWIFTLTLLLGATFTWLKNYREINEKYLQVQHEQINDDEYDELLNDESFDDDDPFGTGDL